MDKLYDSETGCCPRFEPGPWDKKEVTFNDKLFIKDHVTSFFHIPLNMNKVMVRNMDMIPMVLSDENSLWGADIYIAVSKDVQGAEMIKMSGTFLSDVFEGPYKNIRQWISQMTGYVREKGKVMKKLYFFYTTCPACAKYYGKNYVVLLAQI
jgi:effector-binding domain-containing protein